MKDTIELFNRDRANLVLKKLEKVEPNIFRWKLEVDDKHDYVLEYCRFIYQGDPNSNSNIESIDPSGGPFISIGDEFENKYKIVRIYNTNNIWISERNNDN